MQKLGMVTFGLLGLVLLLGACTSREAAAPDSGITEPLAYGWEYACAITNDADDRALCQERIALAHLAHGNCDAGLRLGVQIENWRRGVVLAEAAAKLAEQGDAPAATERIEQAERLAQGIQDWQRDLIMTRAAKAKALLGRTVEVSSASAFYAGNRDYRGETAAYEALALAREGRVEDGLEKLNALESDTEFDVTVWRANGYLLLASAGHLDRAQTTNALLQAWSATERIAGNRRWEVQLALVDAATAGETTRPLAHAWLTEVTSNVLACTLPAHITAPLLVKTATRWGSLGRGDDVAACTRAAEPLIQSLQSIEQPALWALVGEAWVKHGELEKGLTYYNQAMEMARQLTNRRPRALACVDICLSLDQAALRGAQVSAGLARLLSEFHASKG